MQDSFNIVKNHNDSIEIYSKDDIIKLQDFLIDNTIVEFGVWIFKKKKKTVRIPKGTNFPTLPIWFYTRIKQNFFITFSQKKRKQTPCKIPYLTFRYIDDFLSLNNPSFRELRIKVITDARRTVVKLEPFSILK